MAKIANAVEEAAEYAVENVVEAVEAVENMPFLNKYTLIGLGAGVVTSIAGIVIYKKVRAAKAAKALEAGTDAE
jgi:hypothetical protein